MIAWLKCQTRPGAFENEVMVGISTTNGRRHLFVDNSLIRCANEFTSVYGLMVRILPTPSFLYNNQYIRIVLPQKSVEGDIYVSVLVDDISYG